MLQIPNISERMQCPDSDKELLLPLVDMIRRFSEKCRVSGILSLEEDIPSIPYPLLKKGLTLIVDGTDPVIVREILSTYIMVGNYAGKELLERMMILEGVLSVQSGENPFVVKDRLIAYLGENYMKGQSLSNEGAALKAYMETLKNKQCLSPKTAQIDEIFKNMDDRAVQAILREMDSSDLAKALKGASGETEMKVLRNMSVLAASMLVEDMSYMGPIRITDIMVAQSNVLKTIRKLEEMGIIIIL